MFTTSIFVFLLGLFSFQKLHATYLTVIPDDVQINPEGQFLNRQNELSQKKYSFNRVENFIHKDNETFLVSKAEDSSLVFSSGKKMIISTENPDTQLNVQHINFNSNKQADQLTNCVLTKIKKSNLFKDLLTQDSFTCETVTHHFCQKQVEQLKNLFLAYPHQPNQVIKKISECEQRILDNNGMTLDCKSQLSKIDTVNQESLKVLNFNEKNIEQKNNKLIKAMTGSSNSFNVVNKFQYIPLKNNLVKEYTDSVDLFQTSHVLCSHLKELNSKSIIQNKLGVKPNVQLPSNGSSSYNYK